MERTHAQRQEALGRFTPKESKEKNDALAQVHKELLAEFPEPWTIDNLGPYNYLLVARKGQFFDPIQERPGLRPQLQPHYLADDPVLLKMQMDILESERKREEQAARKLLEQM